jgi:hypothetical protein
MTFSITESFAVTPMFKGGMSMVGSSYPRRHRPQLAG